MRSLIRLVTIAIMTISLSGCIAAAAGVAAGAAGGYYLSKNYQVTKKSQPQETAANDDTLDEG